MTSIRDLIHISILFGCVVFEAAMAAPLKCESAETVIFSCSTTASKTIVLCFDERTKLITYRYGTSKKIEMSYSAEQGSENGFIYNHYFRPLVDYSRIAFVTAGYEYSIFRNYDATEAPRPTYGIEISKNGETKAQINCQSKVEDKISKIIKNLKCDNSNSLGCH